MCIKFSTCAEDKSQFDPLDNSVKNIIVNSGKDIELVKVLDDGSKLFYFEGVSNYKGVNEPIAANLGKFSYQFTDENDIIHHKESTYENLIVVDYVEKYDDEQECGEFYAFVLDMGSVPIQIGE